MAWVTEVSEEQASPELKRLYEMLRAEFGFVPDFYKALGLLPKTIEGQLALAPAILSDGALPQKVKEQIAVVVSGLNTSSYCIAMHIEQLRQFGIEKPLGRKLAVDYRSAPVAPNVQALFRYADKLTRKPGDIEKADVDALRAAGWNDEQIIETVLTIALFGFFNRISIGLGLIADFM
ncbi:MAG: peroxidase-related enzyme [Candidatus Acidiferrales bacterium]